MDIKIVLEISEFIALILTALVIGVFWGPWIAISRSMATFKIETFLEITRRMNQNLEGVMSILMPLNLLSIFILLILTFNNKLESFYFR